MRVFVVLHQTEGGDFVWVHSTEKGALRSAAQVIIRDVPHFNDNIFAVIVGDVMLSHEVGKEIKEMFQREEYKAIIEKWNKHWENRDIIQQFLIEEQEVGD